MMSLPNVNHLIHAYKIAPWRMQRRRIGAVALVAIGVAMVFALYMDVSANASIAGREIQDLNAAIQISRQNSADLQTQFAEITSTRVMQERAIALGFRPMEPGEAEYLSVPGYVKPQPQIMYSAPQPALLAPSIPPAYTQSLLDWLDEKIRFSPARGLQ